MKIHEGRNRFWRSPLLVASLAMGMASVSTAYAVNPEDVVAIFSTATSDYVRVKNADGSFQPETYAFAEGDHIVAPIADRSIDQLRFIDVARLISGALAKQNYVPTKSAKGTDLLIMIYWGMTGGSGKDLSKEGAPAGGNDSGQLTGKSSARLDFDNAAMLGYLPALSDFQRRKLTALAWRSEVVMDELRHDRYFVVLAAFDFQRLLNQKEAKILWVSRFSMPKQGNAFNEDLGAMALAASRYFGRSSDGLVRKPAPAVKIELGELKSLGTEP